MDISLRATPVLPAALMHRSCRTAGLNLSLQDLGAGSHLLTLFRIEAADANAHKLRTTLAVTDGGNPDTNGPGRVAKAVTRRVGKRDQTLPNTVTSSVASLSESRATTRSTGMPSAPDPARLRRRRCGAAMRIRTSTPRHLLRPRRPEPIHDVMPAKATGARSGCG